MKTHSDYTYKFNMQMGRHGWLRLTPAYSIKLVEEILKVNQLPLFNTYSKSIKILDPFSGTATTGIVAAQHGYNCTLYDINPFLVWFGNVKSKNYDKDELDEIFHIIEHDLGNLDYLPLEECWIPPIAHIDRWWQTDTLTILANIRMYLSSKWNEPTKDGINNLLWITFARLCIETSAADFSHISVSFKTNTSNLSSEIIISMYLSLLKNIMLSAKDDLPGSSSIIHGDSRYLLEKESYDLLISSPPYPNRISYIRELRPYMYWLKFLTSGQEAGELDWLAIGGTWGVATSKLHTWTPQSPYLPSQALEICSSIKNEESKNGLTMALYVHKFFDDMYLHLSNLREHLNDGASLNYILGNSTFYGHHVDTSSWIVDILSHLGYTNISSTTIRKRNSKSQLYEYLISATWHQ